MLTPKVCAITCVRSFLFIPLGGGLNVSTIGPSSKNMDQFHWTSSFRQVLTDFNKVPPEPDVTPDQAYYKQKVAAFSALDRLYSDFVETAKLVGTLTISEEGEGKKPGEQNQKGGFAGGQKFQVNCISLYKLLEQPPQHISRNMEFFSSLPKTFQR